MPLFFIIPIAAGALTLGATTTDVTTDTRLENRARAAQTQQIQQGQMYQTMAECQQAAAAQGLSANVCQPKS
jgi:hypothetical protein